MTSVAYGIVCSDYAWQFSPHRDVTERRYHGAMSRFVAAVCLLISLSCGVAPALADLRISAGEEEEIRIGNTGWNEIDEPLIPAPLASADEAVPMREAVAVAPMPFADTVREAARATELDPALLHAVIAAESGHNPGAVSPRGARGLMQLMPATARRFGVDNPHDPAQNIHAGARYLRELRDLFRGDLRLALAAYNAGPGAVLKHGSTVPPYEETRRYVPRVMQLYRNLSGRRI